MNSNYGKSTKSGSLNNFDFDFGLNTNRSRPLNEQKNQSSSYYSSSSFSSSQSRSNMAASAPSWQPNKPSWTHQPAPSQAAKPGSIGGPSSVAGDIFGKSWNSSKPSGAASSVGIVNKDPNLFGDLVNLGLNKGNSNVPLKNATPAPSNNKSAYSMGSMADSLPKPGNSAKSGGNWGTSETFGSYTSASNANTNVNIGSNTKNSNLGGPSMRNMTGIGSGMSSNKDPFGSLFDLGSKPGASVNSGTKTGLGDGSFGDFQNASKPSSFAFQSKTPPTNNNNSMGSTTNSYSDMDNFGGLFSTSSSSGDSSKKAEVPATDQFSGADDWGIGSEFGGGNDMGGGTTELEGLPPPPASVSSSTAKDKGMDSYKQGQYADAIKWLSWAVILLEKAGDDAGTMEVLSSRASSYKEVGEYKKAVADCTKVLGQDGANVSVLVQRALLYESMEKYKLGAEDLRTVMKIDPGNRVARSTIHRLNKMAES